MTIDLNKPSPKRMLCIVGKMDAGGAETRWCKFGSIKRYLAVKMMRPFFLHANVVICVSNAAADDLKTFLKLPSNLVNDGSTDGSFSVVK